MDALGAFNAVPQIGMIMVNPGCLAVTVNGEAVPVTLSVGVRPPLYRNGATAFLAESDGMGSPLHVGVVFLIAASV